MKLIALILGFGLEHVASQLLHLRELRWFDAYFDIGLQRAKRSPKILAWVIIALLIALPMVPVLIVDFQLSEADIRWDLSYIVFSLLVVFVCLGPRDLGNEIDEYCKALDKADSELAGRILFELSEAERREINDVEVIEEAVFIQAPNRIFGVVFWFVVLGPVGAWLFRVSDLLRRRTAFEAVRDPELRNVPLRMIEAFHGVLLWVPVRLSAIGYALSGSFDDALNGWREHERAEPLPLHRRNDRLAASVGKAAMAGVLAGNESSSAAARHAMRLVTRSLFMWLIVIALMTIFGWAV
jgi:AmpE protein